jgi:hypothetical protein
MDSNEVKKIFNCKNADVVEAMKAFMGRKL